MAETHESSGMQKIVTRSIELANEAMESGRKVEISSLGDFVESGISSLGALVDCLSSVAKSVFEYDKGGGYLTNTLFTFLLDRPPKQPNLAPLCDFFPDEVAARDLIKSEFHISRLLGLLGLISLHDTCMSLPPLPLPLPEFYVERSNDVAILLCYLGIRGQGLVSLLLNLLMEGNIYDKLISVMALGAIAQQSGDVKQLVEPGVGVEFAETLERGPMLLQAEVAHVISKFVAADPAILDELPLHDLVGSLVTCLQFMTTSVSSKGAASQNSKNTRMIADDQNEKSPEVKARMVATASKTLRTLVNNNPSLCWIVVRGMKGATLFPSIDRALIPLLLNFLRGGSLYDKWISVIVLGAIIQQPGQVERLVEAGVRVEFAKILKGGPMLLQAEVAHVSSKFVAIDQLWVKPFSPQQDPTIQNKLPLHDLVGFLVSHLQFMADDENFQYDINTTASVFSIGAASHNSNGSKIVDYGNEKSPEEKARIVATVAKTLRILVKNDPSLCWIVAEGSKDVTFSLRFLGIDEVILKTGGRAQILLLLNFMRGGSISDKRIGVVALGVIAQQTRKVEHLVAAGVIVVFGKILKEGPMLLQAEVVHVIFKCVAIDPTFRDKLPLDDLITSLVSLLQVEVAEEHLQDDINKATSVLSIVAARHNSNKRKVADDRNEKSMSGELNQLQQEDSPGVKGRMRLMAVNILGDLAKDNAPACQIIVEKRAVLRFAVLLQNERLDVKLSSAMALMEITAVAEKETDLRRSAFKHNSYAHKTVVDQLMRIIEEALDVQRSSTTELLIPCIRAIGNLASTFRGTQPIISLVHLLESSNYEVVKETLVALTKFACRDNSFLHLDHSKAIVSLEGLNRIVHLAADEEIGVEKHALVLLCYIAIDAIGNESIYLQMDPSLQAEVAHVSSKFVAIDQLWVKPFSPQQDPTIQNKLPLHDLVGFLVSHLQFMADDENFQYDINTTASVFSIGAASHNSNGSKIVDYGNEKSPEEKARIVATVAKTLRILVKNDPSLCWIVAEGSKDVTFSLRFLGIDEVILKTGGRAQILLLLNFMRGGSISDKRIGVVALGVIAQQTRKVEHLVAAGVIVVFGKILKEGPMLLQAEVVHVIFKCVAIDPTFRDKLPLDDLITSLVSLLQVEVAEEHLQDDINKATSVLSIVAARHNSNKRKVADDRNEKSMSGELNQLQQEDSPGVKGRMRLMAVNILGDLAKDNAPACQIIVEKRAVLRFAVLLQNERLDVKLSSAMALMEITAVAEKETDLRRSAFKHNSYAHKTVVDQLMRIIEEALDVQRSSTTELLIPCIRAIGNLASTFRGTQPIISLVHLLESSNYEVVKETLVALTKFACRDNSFLHLDHSKAIVSLEGLNRIVHLAADEEIGVEKHALVLLCYIAIDAIGNESEEREKVLSAIKLASRKAHFIKDEALKPLLKQAKQRLRQ